MTETKIESPRPVPPGQAIGEAVGQAQSVLARLLTGVLAQAGAERETYLAAQRLAAIGGTASREDYVRDLSGSMDIDLWSAGQLADRLAGEGLLTLADDTVRLSDAGAELRERAGNGVRDTMAPLWAQIDPADLQATIRTLRDITAKARALYPATAAPGVAGGTS